MVHRILAITSITANPFSRISRALREFGNDTSFTERRAAEAERELIEWKKVKFMQDRVGEEFDALIISTTKFGFFVELTELFVEGLVPIETLPGDHFRYQREWPQNHRRAKPKNVFDWRPLARAVGSRGHGGTQTAVRDCRSRARGRQNENGQS